MYSNPYLHLTEFEVFVFEYTTLACTLLPLDVQLKKKKNNKSSCELYFIVLMIIYILSNMIFNGTIHLIHIYYYLPTAGNTVDMTSMLRVATSPVTVRLGAGRLPRKEAIWRGDTQSPEQQR